MVSRFARVALVCGVASATGYACLSPTQVTLRLSTNVECAKVESGGASIYGNDPKLEPPLTRTSECHPGPASNDLGSLVMVPSGSRDEQFVVAVVLGIDVPSDECAARDYRGCILAKRRVRYVPHEPLEMPIELSLQCRDVACSPDDTCFRGACVGIDVVSQAGCLGPECAAPPLASLDGSSAPATDSASADASLGDASVDGGVVDAGLVDAGSIQLFLTRGAPPRGLAIFDSLLWWSEPNAVGVGSTVRNVAIGSPSPPPAPPLSTVEDVYGIDVTSSAVFFAAASAPGTCGGFWLTSPQSENTVACPGGSGYIGVAEGPFFAGTVDTRVVGGYIGPAATGYAERNGTSVVYVANQTVRVLDLTKLTPEGLREHLCPTGGEALRGLATLSPNRWLVSTATGRIFDVNASAALTTSLVAMTSLTNVEDLAYDAASDRLFIAANDNDGPAIFVLPNMKARLPP